jgi:hypothetical protein
MTANFIELIGFSKNYNQKELEVAKSIDIITNKYSINYFSQSYKKDEQNKQISDLQDMLRHY